jgi:hypothetical protein
LRKCSNQTFWTMDLCKQSMAASCDRCRLTDSGMDSRVLGAQRFPLVNATGDGAIMHDAAGGEVEAHHSRRFHTT